MTTEIATIITSGIIGTTGVIIVAIIKFLPMKKENCDTRMVCQEHSGFLANFQNVQRDITEIKADIKLLLGREHYEG